MIFTIKKNQHYSDQLFYKLCNFLNIVKVRHWSVCFDESCKYDLAGPDQFDVNKLFGFSIGFNHHQESIRFGWRSFGQEIELSAYAYISGKRTIETICTVPLNTQVDLFLAVESSNYRWTVFTRNSLYRETKIPKGEPFSVGYSLWPYFGGNQSAPHDMEIKIIN